MCIAVLKMKASSYLQLHSGKSAHVCSHTHTHTHIHTHKPHLILFWLQTFVAICYCVLKFMNKNCGAFSPLLYKCQHDIRILTLSEWFCMWCLKDLIWPLIDKANTRSVCTRGWSGSIRGTSGMYSLWIGSKGYRHKLDCPGKWRDAYRGRVVNNFRLPLAATCGEFGKSQDPAASVQRSQRISFQ